MNEAAREQTQGEPFTRALGRAVVEVWASLPRNIQQMIFEQAIVAGHHTEQDESLREQLAAWLHARHPRTAGAEDH